MTTNRIGFIAYSPHRPQLLLTEFVYGPIHDREKQQIFNSLRTEFSERAGRLAGAGIAEIHEIPETGQRFVLPAASNRKIVDLVPEWRALAEASTLPVVRDLSADGSSNPIVIMPDTTALEVMRAYAAPQKRTLSTALEEAYARQPKAPKPVFAA